MTRAAHADDVLSQVPVSWMCLVPFWRVLEGVAGVVYCRSTPDRCAHVVRRMDVALGRAIVSRATTVHNSRSSGEL